MIETLSGGQFAREVGVDPKRWATRFLAAYAAMPIEGVRTEEDRLAYVTAWFRCAMDAAASNVDRADLKAEHGH